ncbi:hypothetical protein GCM10011390_31690 [Aureimonas endophytica]|uniref:(S)-ureidoglycine aminohydrolase cupin domain-containing protein n=1 Tax=Aureimonas endophytica TaxID=2027858 RepID=A0A917E6T8_9HYPH|nr:cupin domain-containing protein [Aureimonas endophytica]GGE10329.1 hypothetical protein GCM10011390_31690 [Aureimonas endophytica]
MSALPRAVALRTFHDLSAFAADPEAGTAALEGAGAGGAWTFSRRFLPLAPGPVTVAALSLAVDGGHVEALPADEFVLVLSGAIAVTRPDGAERRFAAGESFVLAKGLSFAWRVDGAARLVVMTYAAPGASGAALVPIDLEAELAPSGAPLAELLVGETPSCRNHTDYRSADGEFVCGVWDSTPYHRRPMLYRHVELMHLLAGSVTFVDEAGREASFATGDTFLVEAGATCSWESREHVAKVYAIHRPA